MTEAELSANDGDGDVDVQHLSGKMVTVSKTEQCIGKHEIPLGTIARYSLTLVDGKWGSYYICKNCMDKWFDELEMVT